MRFASVLTGLVGLALAASVGAQVMPLPESPPEVPEVDLSFLEVRIPAHALGVEPGTDLPTVRWDRDDDGLAEIWALWDEEQEEFTVWTVLDPLSERPLWRLEVSAWHEAPWRIVWDQNSDGVMDWMLLDADRDGTPEEIQWEAGQSGERLARFLDRDGDGRFETRCHVEADETIPGGGSRRHWAFDDDGDGAYEREVSGEELTERGRSPEWILEALTEEPGRADLRWDLITWYADQGDEERWREQVMAYAADPGGIQIYRLLYKPIMRRSFYLNEEFAQGLIDSMRERSSEPQADYVTLWSLGELLRWQCSPPTVHPLLLAQWREAMGLPPGTPLPSSVDTELANESARWFLRSLASEMIDRSARETVAFGLARLHAARGQWDVVDDLCLALVRAAERVNGPMSPRHLEYANICFAHGSHQRAQRVYGAMTAHWQLNPGDPERAVPNHVALIRLGLMAHERGSRRQARYYLIRALDSLSPTVAEPDTLLAQQLLADEGTREAAEEYLEVVGRMAEEEM